MRFLTGPRVFVALLGFMALGVILTLDPSAVLERHRQSALERSEQYQGQYSSAYAHFMRSPTSAQSDPEGQTVSTLAYYYYPAYRHPSDALITAQQAGQALVDMPTAAGGSVEQQINQLTIKMYQHANREEYQEAARLQAQIRSLEQGVTE